VQHEVDKPEPVLPNSSLPFCSPKRHFHPVLPKCIFQSRCSRERFRRRICTLQLDSMLLAHSCAMRRPGGACDVHSLNAYRILEHARLSRGKTITLKCLRLRSKPFIAPMTMHNPLVIMRMYCEAFVVRALRAERKKMESRESTLCTPESPVIVESVSDLVPYWTFSDWTYIPK
jgi:hypothetical protein